MEEATPTWLVVLLALIAGLVGGLGATYLRIVHERGAELRGRMLDAADEFSASAWKTLQRMRTAAGVMKRSAPAPLVDPETELFLAQFETELDDVNAEMDAMIVKQARVHLLFDDLNEAGIAATAIVTHLRNMDMALNTRPDSVRDHNAMAQYSRNWERTVDATTAFNRAARMQLQDTLARRLWRSLRRRWPTRGPNA